MPHYDAEDIVELKNRKKRHKRRMKLLVALLVIFVVFGLYHYRSVWLPKLQGIGKQYSMITNDGKLAEGNFPIEINSGAEYQLSYGDDTLYLLSDAYIYYYNTDGGRLKKRQHAYTNSVMSSAGEYVLVFESGGDELTVETENKILYSKNFDSPIIFAKVSGKGYLAVVTASDNYACELTVFDDEGEKVYGRSCVERINDISFTDGSSGCILSYLGAENGALATTVQKITFDSDKEKWRSPAIDTFGLDIYDYDGGVSVIGYTACAYVDNSGQISSYYKYDGDFAGGDSKSGKTSVIINDDDRRKYTLALFDGAQNPVIVEFDSPLKYTQVYDGLAYVMNQNVIEAYDFKGNLRSRAEISDSYDEFRRSDEYIFLMSYNRVDRIDYES